MSEKNSSSSYDWLKNDEQTQKIIEYVARLGADKFADDIHDERIARRIFELRQVADYYSVQAEIWGDRSENALSNAIKVQAAMYDKAASYNNIVATLGYAAFFTIWTIVSPELSLATNGVIGLLLGASVLIFIGWTLFLSVLVTKSFSRYGVIAYSKFETFAEELEAHKKAEEQASLEVLKIQRWWPLQFSIATFSGFSAGVYLLVKLGLITAGFDPDFERIIFAPFL